MFAEDFDPSNEFDSIIGAIEDIVVDERFQDMQDQLMEHNYHHFEVNHQDKVHL